MNDIKYIKPLVMHKFGIRLGLYVQTCDNKIGEIIKFNEKYDEITIKDLQTNCSFHTYCKRDIKIILSKELKPEYFL